MRPTREAVEAALVASRGLLAPAARAIGMSRSNLQAMVKRYATLEQVRRDQRGVMGDFTESKMFELIGEKHWPAIQFYLSTQCKDRGYILPKGTSLNGDVSNMTVISSVVVNAVPSGRFVDGDQLTIEHESVTGGVVDDYQTKKLG